MSMIVLLLLVFSCMLTYILRAIKHIIHVSLCKLDRLNPYTEEEDLPFKTCDPETRIVYIYNAKQETGIMCYEWHATSGFREA